MIHKGNTISFMGYSGYFSQDILKALLKALENQMKELEEKQSIANRLNIVFIELFQNIMKYSKKDYLRNNNSEQILIEQDEHNYYVTTINNIDKRTLYKIKSVLLSISELNKEEITNKYNELRRSGENTHENGGGIGFYQVARKSENIFYEIKTLEDNVSRLSITVQINKAIGGKKIMESESIFIEKTLHTPEIDFNFEKGIFKIEGKSYSENTFEFYKPLLNSIESFFMQQSINHLKNISFNFNLTYFNSSSSKALFDLFDLIDIFMQNQSEIDLRINWLYDENDESSKEDGEDFQDSFESLNILLIENKK